VAFNTAFARGGGGGGGSPINPGSSKNFLVADDAEAAALTGLRSGDTVRISSSGANAEVKLWQVTAPNDGTYPNVTKFELDTREARVDATDIVTVANEVDRLALVDKYSPFRVVKQTDTDEFYLQTANPSSADTSWLLLSGQPSFTLQDGGDTLTDGGDPLKETGGNSSSSSAPSQPAYYEHTQAVAAAVWTINHNLGFRPNIITFDTSNEEIIGDVQSSPTTSVVTFSRAFAGNATAS
jgi:hypothetical protein